MSKLVLSAGGLRMSGGGVVWPGGGLVNATTGADIGLYGQALASATAVGDLTPVASYTLDTLTPSDIAAIASVAAPDYGWDAGAASGATDLVGSDNLVDLGTVVKESVDATLSGKTTETDLDVAEGLNAATSAIANPGAETVTGVLIFRLTAASSGFLLGAAQKRDSAAGNNGWEVYVQNRQMSFAMDTAAGVIVRTIAVDHGTTNAQVVLFTRSTAGATVGSVFSREGSSTGTCNTDTLASSALLAMGGGTLREKSPGANFAKLFLWHGTSGDFGNDAAFEAARSAIAVALGYE